MTENDVVDIGLQLRALREKLGYSLQDVAQNTRIRKTYLESIENNQFADLPGQAYVTGFVKAYARYLGADNDTLLSLLESTRLIDDSPSLKPFNTAMRHPERLEKSAPRTGRVVLVLGVLTVFLLCVAIYFLTPLFQNHEPTEAISGQSTLEKKSAQDVVGEIVAEKSVISPTQEEQIPAAESKPGERQPLPPIPSGGAALRMLALSEGSLIIDLDGRTPQPYKLYGGLDLAWKIKKIAKIEISEPGVAQFWLGEQLLDVGGMGSFQLQTTSGD